MYCHNCGAEVKGNFCDKCGAPAAQTEEKNLSGVSPYLYESSEIA